MNLHQLQEAFKNGNKLQFKRNKSSTLKSGKKAVKVCSQAAYERTETYRLMGVYYWLTDKQKNAVKWWEKSILEAEKMGARLELSRTYLEVGRRLSETKSKFQKLYGIDANTYLKKARILFEEMDLQWDLKELDKMF